MREAGKTIAEPKSVESSDYCKSVVVDNIATMSDRRMNSRSSLLDELNYEYAKICQDIAEYQTILTEVTAVLDKLLYQRGALENICEAVQNSITAFVQGDNDANAKALKPSLFGQVSKHSLSDDVSKFERLIEDAAKESVDAARSRPVISGPYKPVSPGPHKQV